MKFTLTFAAAWAINILLFLTMIQMITANHEKKWIRTTSGDFFNFIRQAPKTDLIPRRPAKTPPKPTPEPEAASFSNPAPNPTPPAADMRALPLPVAALKVDIPLTSSINIGSGPSLPRVVAGGQSRTGVLSSGPAGGSGARSGFAQPSFIMADELTAIMKVEPVYPQALRFRRIQGEVLLEFTVIPDGTVSDAKVLESSPSGSFDRTSLRAIRRWRFQPPSNDQGKPMAVRVRQRFVFKLH